MVTFANSERTCLHDYTKACQRIGWSDHGHKIDCKLLKDNDLKRLFTLDWNKFEDVISFPLADLTSERAKIASELQQ